MSSTPSRPRFSLTVATAVVAVLSLVSLVGCSKSTNPISDNVPKTYTGSVTGLTTSGKLSVTFPTAPATQGLPTFRNQATVAVTGMFTPSGGAAVTLAGTYDTVLKTFVLTGGGWTFSGTVTSSGIEGGFTGPGGTSGVFDLQTGANVIVIVGRFGSTIGDATDHGVFNFSISGSVLHGSAESDSGGGVVPLDGTYNVTTHAISIKHPENPTGAPLATGTFNAATGVASGTYNDQGGNVGSWEGTVQ